MPQIIAGVSGVNRKIKKIPLGVQGVNRDCKTAWAGVDGVNRKVFSKDMDASGWKLGNVIHTTNSTIAFNSIMCVNNRFYVSIQDYKTKKCILYYSSDGISWANANLTDIPINVEIYDMAYFQGHYVAVGYNSTSSTAPAYGYKSTTGINNWAQMNMKAVGSNKDNWAPSKMVALSNAILAFSRSGTCASTTDLITWKGINTVTSTINAAPLNVSDKAYLFQVYTGGNLPTYPQTYEIEYVGGTYAGIKSNSYSQKNFPQTGFYSAAYGNGKFVLGTTNNGFATSSSINAFPAENNVGLHNTYPNNLAFGGGVFVGAPRNGAFVYSEDGENWTKKTIDSAYCCNAFNTFGRMFVYGSGKFVGVNMSGTNPNYSYRTIYYEI